MKYQEINFDGLVGPTHNYAGLSYGNLASTRHRAAVSNPRAAALQGLLKAKTLADWGFPQAVLPPQERPSIQDLISWGFSGTSESNILSRVSRQAPEFLAAAASASSMWTANACTMAPSCDTSDNRAHFTIANLSGNLHRSIEAPFTHRILQAVFDDDFNFAVHPALSGGQAMADEGAANHTRLSHPKSPSGLHLFVYGRSALGDSTSVSPKFPARQTAESSQAVARLNHLQEGQVLFLQQSPEAIDAGVFHNDVISVGSMDVLLYHEQAFAGGESDIERITHAFLKLTGHSLRLVRVKKEELSLEEAVSTYLFNSQLLSMKDGGMLIAVPADCLDSGPVSELLSKWVENRSNPISEVVSFNLHESMRNGGGPACLRQRVVLSDREREHMRGRLLLDQNLFRDLVDWVERHYRDHLKPQDLADPLLLEESRTCLDELTGILRLPSIYPFQR